MWCPAEMQRAAEMQPSCSRCGGCSCPDTGVQGDHHSRWAGSCVLLALVKSKFGQIFVLATVRQSHPNWRMGACWISLLWKFRRGDFWRMSLTLWNQSQIQKESPCDLNWRYSTAFFNCGRWIAQECGSPAHLWCSWIGSVNFLRQSSVTLRGGQSSVVKFLSSNGGEAFPTRRDTIGRHNFLPQIFEDWKKHSSVSKRTKGRHLRTSWTPQRVDSSHQNWSHPRRRPCAQRICADIHTHLEDTAEMRVSRDSSLTIRTYLYPTAKQQRPDKKGLAERKPERWTQQIWQPIPETFPMHTGSNIRFKIPPLM